MTSQFFGNLVTLITGAGGLAIGFVFFIIVTLFLAVPFLLMSRRGLDPQRNENRPANRAARHIQTSR
jgi:hypothetical protein